MIYNCPDKYYYLARREPPIQRPVFLRKEFNRLFNSYTYVTKNELHPKYNDALEREFEANEEIIKKYYNALSPLFSISFVEVVDDDYMFKDFAIIIEPYPDQDSTSASAEYRHGSIIHLWNIIADFIPEEGITYYQYLDDNPKKEFHYKDEKWKPISKGYGYYTDTPYFLFYSVLKNGFKNDDDLFKAYMRFLQDEDKIKLVKENSTNNQDQIFYDAMMQAINIVIQKLFGIYNISQNDWETLLKIYKLKRTETEEDIRVLNKIYHYSMGVENSIQSIRPPFDPTSMDLIDYNFRVPIDKIKSDNPTHTIVKLRIEESGQASIVLFQEKPVFLRSEEDTGFKREEMSKILNEHLRR